ncbi:MAG: hypothetical protein WCA46_13340, partial [Actinocatenispora sp.]
MRGDRAAADTERARWQEQRQRAISVHAEAQRQRESSEARQARDLVAGFARRATERGLRPTPLQARAFNGRARYRTGLHGWYLKPDRSLAVGTDGEFYILAVPASVRARVTGAHLTPGQPRLTIGEGARDGESIPLRTLLQLRLDGGDDWP